MAFDFIDPTGDHIDIEPVRLQAGGSLQQAVAFRPEGSYFYVPLDQVEEFIAGVRDMARQAARLPMPTPTPAPDRGCQCIPGIPCDHCHATTPAAEVVSP